MNFEDQRAVLVEKLAVAERQIVLANEQIAEQHKQIADLANDGMGESQMVLVGNGLLLMLIEQKGRHELEWVRLRRELTSLEQLK